MHFKQLRKHILSFNEIFQILLILFISIGRHSLNYKHENMVSAYYGISDT